MISTEKAFDMLPHVVDIFDKVDAKQYILDNQFSTKDGEDTEKKTMELGFNLASHILKQAPRVKEEFFNIVAIVDDKEVEEVKKQSLLKTINTIKELFGNEEIISFFKSAMK